MSTPRRWNREVTDLIDRIRELVAEQGRPDSGPSSKRRESNDREIARLQRRLASAVKRELTH